MPNQSPPEPRIRAWGEQILALVDKAEAPSLFSSKGFYAALMQRAMADDHFKTQLFRFVDVLPTLNSNAELSSHLKEYLGDGELKDSRISPLMRVGLKAATGMSWLFGSGVKAQVTSMARQFMLGDDPRESARTLRALNDKDIAFTVDILGETVVSEAEADGYAQRCLDLLNSLSSEVSQWKHAASSNMSSRGPVPALNLSIKISALYSQIHPTAPEIAIEHISARLRPILRRARELGAFINFDMESYALKQLTLRLFQSLFAEEEFCSGPSCGLAVQAYLRDSQSDLRQLIDWARPLNRRITVRLVKGAYWDYETIMAHQRHWPVPVFAHKWETDVNFERLSLLLLENADVIDAAFGTHNVRSIAHALAQAERLGVDRRAFEFQMLYGMAEPIKQALLELGCRVREYCPIGELLPGMAYLVRRLLENTSNEGFLANKFARGASHDDLLKPPLVGDEVTSPPSTQDLRTRQEHEKQLDQTHLVGPATPRARESTNAFQNEPHTDFTIPENRERIREALKTTRTLLGQKHPLVINHQPVFTKDWLPSLNPANQDEVVAYAAQATIADAETAVSAALAAQPKWAATSPEQRASTLEKAGDWLRRSKPQLTAVEILEAGKNWQEADADVAEAIDFCTYYAAVMREMGTPRLTQEVAGEINLQHWWPRGVGVIIAPWNFPLAILTGMAAAAVVCGNAVIMKPSDQTPWIAAFLMEAFVAAGIPPGVVNLVTGPGSTVGAHLVAHPKIDLIAFTGSKEVGLKIWETAGRTAPGQPNLKKVICEMGGKNALIVDNDADLDEAVAGCIASAFGYQGQKCSALSRLIVLADNYDRFMERLIAAASSLRIGPAEDPAAVIGPVISRQAQQRILATIESGTQEATLVWQHPVDVPPMACYVPPAIFTDVPPTSTLFREEIFGPVLSVTKARDFDEALALANDSEFALTGGLYSRSPAHIERAKREMVCGNLYINRTITGAIVQRQPFAGFKMSGAGTKAGGSEYLQQFMVPRVVTENVLRRGFAPGPESATS